jgi:mannose/cellobiose epimerase-like protein (N-acyl-D-glucosamine 2-epimerase family)
MPHTYPNFESPDFLEAHVKSILTFYDPRVFAPEGGFYGCFLDNGDCYDPHARQLVASCRYVVNYATAFRLYGQEKHLNWAKWGLDYLQTRHKQANGAYAWQVDKDVVTDRRIMAYGHAFVLLAAAACLRAGIKTATKIMHETFAFLESYFWDESAGLYGDERDESLERLSPYRGQNANMHMCEALLAAWQASGDIRFLDRAEQLAERFAFELAKQAGGQIWEHYDANWTVDMNFNIDKPNDRYRPWGFQPGHQTEWAKLLLILNGERPDDKWVSKAKQLYDQALKTGWDAEHGGLVYGVAPGGAVCASEKHFWVQSESFAAAWRLYCDTGEQKYKDDYNRIWMWSWDHMVDHKFGAWFRVRHRNGAPIDNKKSPLGKTDYHTMGACWDVLSLRGKANDR